MRAGIDVGTNTVRLLVGEVHDGQIIPQRYCRRITRLGGGMTAAGLAPEAMLRTLAALREFAAVIAENQIAQLRSVGTEVLRTAVNAVEFVRQVEETTGIALEIIDGEEEARLAASGVLAALDPPPSRCLIIDIGGGSTEFILWQGGKALLQRSYPLGVVRLAEGFSDAASRLGHINEILHKFLAEIEKNDLRGAVFDPACQLVGTAGTITTVAALQQQMREYDWRRINNLVLYKSDLGALLQRLEPLSVADREKLPGMEAGRGDLIVPGLSILLSILDRLSFDRLTVSDFGLLEGILLEG